MKFTEEMVKSARECKSVDEIMGLAKDNGIDITEGEARSYFAKFNHNNIAETQNKYDFLVQLFEPYRT